MVPVPLHSTLGLGNDGRELFIVVVRIMDGEIGKKAAAFTKATHERITAITEAQKTDKEELAQRTLCAHAKCDLPLLSQKPDEFIQSMEPNPDMPNSIAETVKWYRTAQTNIGSLAEKMKADKKEKADLVAALKNMTKDKLVGKHELWWTAFLISNGIMSEVYHGGDWAGHACKNFLGVTSGRSSLHRDYQQLGSALLDRIRALTDGELDANVKQDLIDFVQLLIRIMRRLAAAVKFYSKIVPCQTKHELEAGIDACKEYCSYYRAHLVDKNCPSYVKAVLGKLRRMKPKHHVVETEIPIFARQCNVVGLFSEDIVETVHREVNVIVSSVTNLKNQPLALMQYTDDMFNLYFEVACREAMSKSKQSKWELPRVHQCHTKWLPHPKGKDVSWPRGVAIFSKHE